MISAAFSIVKQPIALGCFPQLSVQHVSDKVPYQIPMRSCIFSDIVPAVLRLDVVIHPPVIFACNLCHVRLDHKMAVCVCSHLLGEQP